MWQHLWFDKALVSSWNSSGSACTPRCRRWITKSTDSQAGQLFSPERFCCVIPLCLEYSLSDLCLSPNFSASLNGKYFPSACWASGNNSFWLCQANSGVCFLRMQLDDVWKKMMESNKSSKKLASMFSICRTTGTHGSVKISFFHFRGPNARVLPWVILKDLLFALFTVPCLCSHTSAKITTLKTHDETRNLKIGRPSKTQDRLSMASSWAHPTHRDEEAAKKDGYCLGIVYGPLLWHLLVTFLEKHNLVHRAQTTFYAAFYENGKQGKFTLPSFTAWARKFFQCEDSETTLLRCKSKFSIRLSCQKTWWLNCSGSLNQNYKSS